MPKRRKKVELKKISRRKSSSEFKFWFSRSMEVTISNLASRDLSTSVASPNASLEQSITSGYEVVWNDKSPVTGIDCGLYCLLHPYKWGVEEANIIDNM